MAQAHLLQVVVCMLLHQSAASMSTPVSLLPMGSNSMLKLAGTHFHCMVESTGQVHMTVSHQAHHYL